MDINGIMKNKITKKSTIRDVMQILGTNLLREGFNSNIHVATTLGSIKENEKIIITDVRFPNEAQAIKNKGGILIRVNRPIIVDFHDNYVDNTYENDILKVVKQINNSTKWECELKNQHESEKALDDYKDWDYVIDNNSDIQSLIEKVKEILVKENII